MFKLQSPSKYSPFDAKHLLRRIFQCSKQFWTCQLLCLLVLLLFFVSPLPHRQNLSLWGLFKICTNRKNCLWQDQVNRDGGHGGHAGFGQNLLNTQHSVGRCACESPIMKCADMLSLQTNPLKPSTVPHNNVSWYTDTDGFLEHSPSRVGLYYKGPALQKII